MKSRVTTQNGDQGTTRLLSGAVVSKSHLVLDCTGAVDRLRAQVALLRLHLNDGPEESDCGAFLLWVLHTTFLIGTEVNDPQNVHPEYRQQTIGPQHLSTLELEQARLEETLRLPRSFIVSATTLPAAHADIAATVARDLERLVVRLAQEEPRFDAAHLLPFLNRLSDYLFILARHLEQGRHHPLDYDLLKRSRAGE